MNADFYILNIYVSVLSSETQAAIAHFKKALNETLGEAHYELKVISLLEHPELADDEMVVATPTVVRKLPQPLQKFIVDISSMNNIMVGVESIKNS